MKPSRIALAVAAALLLGPLAANASVKPVPTNCEIPTSDGSCVRVLYAGQNEPVGRVEVRREGTRALVVFRVEDPRWTLIETHLYAANTPPTTSAPGQFPYKHEWINTSVDSYLLTLGSAEECLYVAAHGIVAKVTERQAPNLDLLAATLPQTTGLQVVHPGEEDVDSYFDATLDGVDLRLLDGTYDAWCADAKLAIEASKLYQAAAVYSSYEPLPEDLELDKDNLDLVNWTINQDWEGYTWQEVQCALWRLMGTLPDSKAGLDFVCGALDSYNAKADAIVEKAKGEGEGYLPPACDARIGLVLVPPAVEGTVPQPVLAQVPIAQLGSFCFATYDAAVTETVWACGDTRLRGGWGSYFECGGVSCATSSTSPPRRRK